MPGGTPSTPSGSLPYVFADGRDAAAREKIIATLRGREGWIGVFDGGANSLATDDMLYRVSDLVLVPFRDSQEDLRVARPVGEGEQRPGQPLAEVGQHRRRHGEQLRRRPGRAGAGDEERAFAGEQHAGLAGRHALDERFEPFVGPHRHALAKGGERRRRIEPVQAGKLRAGKRRHPRGKNLFLGVGAAPEAFLAARPSGDLQPCPEVHQKTWSQRHPDSHATTRPGLGHLELGGRREKRVKGAEAALASPIQVRGGAG